MRKLLDLRCTWCETYGDYETPEGAVLDGWMHMEVSQEGELLELDFCDWDCFFSWMPGK